MPYQCAPYTTTHLPPLHCLPAPLTFTLLDVVVTCILAGTACHRLTTTAALALPYRRDAYHVKGYSARIISAGGAYSPPFSSPLHSSCYEPLRWRTRGRGRRAGGWRGRSRHDAFMLPMALNKRGISTRMNAAFASPSSHWQRAEGAVGRAIYGGCTIWKNEIWNTLPAEPVECPANTRA